ncbi:MAG: PspA/IM30 family protein [Polyangiaceae bacterium]|jgi:phage shock protein A|nr:PspA/IM30 family protein [Polyangiaceae bacterium]
MSSVAGRFWSFVKGLFWQGQKSLEQANPEAVYEMAIQKMKSNYQHMHTAVGRLAAERNRLRAIIDGKKKQLQGVEADLDAALAEAQAGNGQAAEIGEDLVNEKEALVGEIATVQNELASSEAAVNDYLGKLRVIEAQTKQMESKKDAMIAKLHSAQARKAFGDMVSGMSTSAEEAAVGDIDKYIEGVAAQADIAEEMSGATRDEQRRKLKDQARTRQAKSKFQAMLEARQGAAAGVGAGPVVKAAEGKGGIG